MISLLLHRTFRHTVCGIALILTGICRFISAISSINLLPLGGCFLVIGLIFEVIALLKRPEPSDEMAHTHMRAATSLAYHVLHYCIILVLTLYNLSDIFSWGLPYDLVGLLLFFWGMGEAIVGITFLRLEKEGE